jgi:NAD(P)-dependent dehydrogenase (short-subunit alcohol dehydrogenase family)
LGGIDVLMNNAGIGAVGHVGEHGDDEWFTVLDVNVIGIARVTRAALPYLRRSEHAAIVNTCSAAASSVCATVRCTARARARSPR